MKVSILALAMSLTLAAYSHPALAQDTTPQSTAPNASTGVPVDDTATDANKNKKAGPKLEKPIPKRATPDTGVVVGGILGGLAVIGAVAGGGGGGGNDNPSSP
jgi:hypothetical protein